MLVSLLFISKVVIHVYLIEKYFNSTKILYNIIHKIMEVNASPVTPSKARKRIKQESKWQRNVAKKLRYSAKDLPTYPQCEHTSGTYKCKTLKMVDIQMFHKRFYATPDKLIQDSFITSHCTISGTKRRRPKNETYAPKTTHIKCSVRDQNKQNIPVCQNTFLKILGITKHRLNWVMKKFAESGHVPVETRGGDRKKFNFQEQHNAVQHFISQFKCVESHFCRAESSKMYLPSELNINKMYRMYTAQSPEYLQVKSSYFRMIFNTKFNLSFKTPRTDVCSKCLEFTERLKYTTDPAMKERLLTDRKVHNLRAKAFFKLLQEENPEILTLSFDCQKNLVLPKVPDQSAYYSRQLYMYNFVIVKGSSKSNLLKENVFSYYWTEDEFDKGSNEIASAVFDCLNKIQIENSNKIIRLVADGCSGQNKNSTVIGMCCKWLSCDAPPNIRNIQLVFPVVGHSFLPSDRVFGHIEKKIQRIEVISDPKEYVDIFAESATLVHLGEDCKNMDWKSAIQKQMKPPGSWHFRFKECKRYYLKRSTTSNNILIRGEIHYNNDFCVSKAITKVGRSVISIKPDEIKAGAKCVNPLKLRDVKKLLLKHFGPDWNTINSLKYYNELLGPDESFEDSSDRLPFDFEGCEFEPEIAGVLV